MSSENKYILSKASHVAACDCCLFSTNGSANKCDCQRKKKKRKGAERDISFYMQINKCSFLDIQAWIRAYFKLSSKHFILLYSACSFKFLCLVVSMIRYHSKKPLIWFCYCWLVKQLKLKVQIQ